MVASPECPDLSNPINALVYACVKKSKKSKKEGARGGQGGHPPPPPPPKGGGQPSFCSCRQTPRIFHWRHRGPAPNPAAGGGRYRGVHMTVLIIRAGFYTVKPEPRTTTYSTHTTAEDPDQTAEAAICVNCRRCVVNPLWHSGHRGRVSTPTQAPRCESADPRQLTSRVCCVPSCIPVVT